MIPSSKLKQRRDDEIRIDLLLQGLLIAVMGKV
jgi:hypothetical protein